MSGVRYDIDAVLGANAMQTLVNSFPGPAHVIVIALPFDPEARELGQPTFLSTLSPEELKQVLAALGAQLPGAGLATIHTVYDGQQYE